MRDPANALFGYITEEEVRNIEEFAGPFSFWNSTQLQLFEEGIQKTLKARLINEVWCDEYVFTKEDAKVKRKLYLFIDPESLLPLYAELFWNVNGKDLHITQELSHINDPANVIVPPGTNP
jgi:hypothetical protein